jgi:hypothetical protein
MTRENGTRAIPAGELAELLSVFGWNDRVGGENLSLVQLVRFAEENAKTRLAGRPGRLSQLGAQCGMSVGPRNSGGLGMLGFGNGVEPRESSTRRFERGSLAVAAIKESAASGWTFESFVTPCLAGRTVTDGENRF